MTDIEILFHTFAGGDLAQSVNAQLGAGMAEQCYLAALKDALTVFADMDAKTGKPAAVREIGRSFIELAEHCDTK